VCTAYLTLYQGGHHYIFAPFLLDWTVWITNIWIKRGSSRQARPNSPNPPRHRARCYRRSPRSCSCSTRRPRPWPRLTMIVQSRWRCCLIKNVLKFGLLQGMKLNCRLLLFVFLLTFLCKCCLIRNSRIFLLRAAKTAQFSWIFRNKAAI
jgi:hypothetical protein